MGSLAPDTSDADDLNLMLMNKKKCLCECLYEITFLFVCFPLFLCVVVLVLFSFFLSFFNLFAIVF